MECRESVIAAFKHDPGPFSHLEFAAMEDPQGRFGRSQRRNDGIRRAMELGMEWVFFIDADDLMLPSAFSSFSLCHEEYDAVWGAILEQSPGQQPCSRPNQVMPIHSLITLLDNDPFLTLQMGHFVRVSAASKIMFDPSMDAGEDFKYYLGLWRDFRCMKLDRPLFINRRGRHSSGPRSATGEQWTDEVSRVFVDFRIENNDLIESLRRSDEAGHIQRHVVLSGFSRSGTTMFYSMLRHSVSNFRFLDREYPAARAVVEMQGDVITKRPLDIFDIGNIIAANKMHKRLDFVVLLRDIRSVVTSMHPSVPGEYFIGHDYQYFIPPEGPPTRTLPGVLATYQAILSLFKTEVPGKRVVVRYEDLVLKTTRVQEYLGQVLRLGYCGRFEDFYQTEIPDELVAPLNHVSAPDGSRVDKWRSPEHRDRIRTQFLACPALFDVLIQTGYERDRSWFSEFE